jgi:hypothetical protein
MPRTPCCIVQWAQVWEATQVELHGHYTSANLQALEKYHTTTSWRRALLVCVLAPLPCVVVIVGIDLLPLEPPALGPHKSPHLWIRALVTVTMLTYCMLQQFKHHLPQLALTHWIMTTTSLAASMSSVAFGYAMALVIGYPLPFHMIVGMPAWGITVVAMVLLFRGRKLASNHRLARSLRQYLLVFVCQMAMTVVYPVFNYFYSTLSSTQQTGAVLLLPVIKLITKNWISRSLPDSDDAKPEAVVFNVEIFHALFVSICMGSTSSPRTVVALMVIDLIQAWLSFKDMQGPLTDLSPILDKLAQARRRLGIADASKALQGLVAMCDRVIECEPIQLRRGTRSRWFSSKTGRQVLARGTVMGRSQVVPTTGTLDSPTEVAQWGLDQMRSIVVTPEEGPSATQMALTPDLASLNIVERSVLVTQTQKVLFITEFVVLVEYTEVVMPMVFSEWNGVLPHSTT